MAGTQLGQKLLFGTQLGYGPKISTVPRNYPYLVRKMVQSNLKGSDKPNGCLGVHIDHYFDTMLNHMTPDFRNDHLDTPTCKQNCIIFFQYCDHKTK